MRARIRSVKPEVLSDEELWDLGQTTGFPILQIFEGLWMYADREGRFEWRPRALKPLIVPYWDGPFESALNALEESGFLRRYEVDGRTYGLVANFLKHQTPNHREPPSEIPAPPAFSTAEAPDTGKADTRDDSARARPGTPGHDLGTPVSSGNGLGTELGMGGERGVRAPCAPTAPPTPPIPPEPFEAEPWTAERAAMDFRAAFLERYGTEPSMGGKSLAGFAERVATTAQRRGVAPRALYAEVLRKWLLQPRDAVERRAPYACFAQAWGELTMPAEALPRDVSRGYVPSRSEEAYASQRPADATTTDDLVFEGKDVPWET